MWFMEGLHWRFISSLCFSDNFYLSSLMGSIVRAPSFSQLLHSPPLFSTFTPLQVTCHTCQLSYAVCSANAVGKSLKSADVKFPRLARTFRHLRRTSQVTGWLSWRAMRPKSNMIITMDDLSMLNTLIKSQSQCLFCPCFIISQLPLQKANYTSECWLHLMKLQSIATV